MVKVPSARRRPPVGAGRLERFAVQLFLSPSDRPRGIANPGHKSGRTAEVDPGVGVRSPQILRQPLARTLPLV